MSLVKVLPQVNRPSRYLGGELGSIKKNIGQEDITFALAFPDVYEVGMSNIGFAILYHVLNSRNWIAAERVYAPWPDMAKQLRASNTPLFSLESERPLNEFDIVGFTLQYELSYSNVLGMLSLAGIPLRREQRSKDEPLIVVGGPCAFNPEPLADFIDCAVIGDGEEVVIELCEALRASRAAGECKENLLKRLAEIEGVYVPSLFTVDYRENGEVAAIHPHQKNYSRVRRRFLKNLSDSPYPTNPIVPFMNTVHNRVAVEIARGCTRGCRFCQAGYIYRPVRERDPQRITSIIETSLENSGYEEVSLLSLSTGDYTCIEPLLKGLMERYAEEKVAISFPSLRVGSLTPEMMEEIKKVRKTGFTLAPEAGTERLRQVINKGITEDDLLNTSRTIFSLGWRLIKLYFMLGLPTETWEDLNGIVELAARVKHSGKGTQGGATVNVSASTFVPKPHTPFQWERQISLEETIQKQELLRENVKKKKLRLKWHDAHISFLEGVFARGDRRLGAVLEKAVALGCQFDGWSEHFQFDRWMEAFSACGIAPEWYLRKRSENEILPWEHIDCGISKEFLIKERYRALAGSYTPDCRSGACTGCGICDFKDLRMSLTQEAPPSPAQLPEKLQEDEGERHKIRLQVRKDGKARFVSHLEFMTVFHRAVRRAKIPVRFSCGFHPAPRISFPDALPTGVESTAEIIDMELSRPKTAQQIVKDLNTQLPEGFEVLEGAIIPPKTPSPSASIGKVIYCVLPPANTPADLKERLSAFLAASEVIGKREKKGKSVTVDLRPDVIDLALSEGKLWLTLAKGSPIVLAAHLLDLPTEEVRQLGIRKTAALLSQH